MIRENYLDLLRWFGLILVFLVLEITAAPYPASQIISKVSFDTSTLVRKASGSDNWACTWGTDGHKYILVKYQQGIELLNAK